MRLKENYNIRKIGDEYMMVSQSGSGLDYTRVVSLNSSAAFLIEKIKGRDFTVDDLTGLLVENYGIARERAEADANVLEEKMVKEGLVVRDV
ncbi:MAG: PqqD family protein [Bacteroidales bacterium]|nr:PqqD family protein [Bacteroidales bacterium]